MGHFVIDRIYDPVPPLDHFQVQENVFKRLLRIVTRLVPDCAHQPVKFVIRYRVFPLSALVFPSHTSMFTARAPTVGNALSFGRF
jgi:hypothetical protein